MKRVTYSCSWTDKGSFCDQKSSLRVCPLAVILRRVWGNIMFGISSEASQRSHDQSMLELVVSHLDRLEKAF